MKNNKRKQIIPQVLAVLVILAGLSFPTLYLAIFLKKLLVLSWVSLEPVVIGLGYYRVD